MPVIPSPTDAVTWWTAFGAVAQAIGALATFAAVAVSLWVVRSERRMSASGSATIMVSFVGDGTPGVYMLGFNVLNTGVRSFQVSTVGWRTGWLRRGPAALRHRYAIQNLPNTWRVVEPGRSEGFYVSIADLKAAPRDASDDMFKRRVPILGYAPIRAMINITGRQSLLIKPSDSLAAFLRTNEHASTTADNPQSIAPSAAT